MKVLAINKKYLIIFLLIFILVGSFFIGDVVSANNILSAGDGENPGGETTITGAGEAIERAVSNGVASIFGHIIQFLVWILGGILLVLIWILIWVAQYNDFIGSSAVEYGWVIVRDLCNMFFILILLIIAFATILKVESYNAKKLLPKLFLMAILINFSKTICGLAIDFSQVIMLTFVNGFKDIGAGNLTEMLGIKEMLKISFEAKDVTLLSTVGSYFLALIYALISVVVILAMVGTLVIRMVMLWIYIVLSPLAYLLAAFPAGQKYSSRWWSDFSKQVVVGPLLAFFIWLSFISLGGVGVTGQKILKITPSGEKPTEYFSEGIGKDSPYAGVTEAGSPDHMIKFIISIGMLLGGLMVTQELGGVIGSAAGKGMAAIQKGRGLAWGATKFGADYLNLKQFRKTGLDFHPGRQAERLKTGFNRLKEEDLNMGEISAQRNLNLGGLPGYVSGFTSSGWVDQNFKGFLGLSGLGRAISTPFGAGGKINRLNDKADQKKLEADSLISDKDHASRLNIINDKYKESIKEANNPDLESNQKNEIISSADRIKKEKTEALNKMEVYGTEKETLARKNILNEEASKLREAASLYKITDVEGKIALRNGVAEKAKGLTSTNEDELFSQFETALAHNNALAAAAIAQQMVKIGGGDTLVTKFGYQANTGMSKEEAKKYKAENGEQKYNENRGISDFMRDIFQDKLKMNEQAVFTLQSDFGSIAEGNSHAYWRKTTNVDPRTGKLIQNTSEDAQNAQIAEDRKAENEGRARKGNRYEYGAENANKGGNFDWSKSGLTKFINNLDLNLKEMRNNRFNKNAAAVITDSPEAMKDLTKAIEGLKKMGMENIKLGDKEVPIDKFVEIFKKYGELARNSISVGERIAKKAGEIKS